MRLLDTKKQSDHAQTLTKKFSETIVSQTDATQALVNLLEKYQSGFYDKTKPIGSLLFLGPTGTGKTATCETFAEALFHNSLALIKVDCAEFQHSHEIAKLIGSPPGYLGHRETPPYFTQTKINMYQTPELPISVILFDEIEKASDALWNLLLGILDKGTLTCGDNSRVDLTHCIILMTSNVGAKALADKAGGGLGFAALTGATKQELTDTAMSAARAKFMPEFLNRLDGIVMFNTLTEEEIAKILDIECNKLRFRCVTNEKAPFFLTISPYAKKKILEDGYDKKYGARSLKRSLDKLVSLPVGRAVAANEVKPGDSVVVDVLNDRWEFYVESAPATLASSVPKG